MTFFERLKLAWLFLIGRQPLPGQANPVAALQASAPVAPPVQLTPEQVHASALFFLGLLQREGRLLDFLQEDIAQQSGGNSVIYSFFWIPYSKGYLPQLILV